MDISKIDFSYIELFDLSYESAESVFGIDPIAAPAKKQKKIRKYIQQNYIDSEIYSPACPEVMQYVGKEVSDKDFIEFIKACHDYVQINGTHKKQLFNEFSTDFSEEVKAALWALLERDCHLGNFRMVGENAQIDVDNGAGYDRTLTLVNATGVPKGRVDNLSFEHGSLIKQDYEYILSGEAEDYDEDSSNFFSIRFTDAKVDIVLSKAGEGLFMQTPWTHLESIAVDIFDKYIYLPAEYLNDREREILPLIAEISKLSYWAVIPDEFKSVGFPQLRAYIVKYGYNELLPLVERLEKEYFDGNKKYSIIEKLTSKLNTQKYEPLWRELYNILVESQAEYPSRTELFCPTELLNETRSNIQKLMEAHGYSGEYPDFVKKGAIRGIRLAESYDENHFVGHEKNVVYHIHCTEEYFGEHLMIQFLCGTELLKKNETAGDVYSCVFNAKGRRLFQTMSYESEYINFNGEVETQDLEQRVEIAVKKAELIKLTKEERREIGDVELDFWQRFLIGFLAIIVLGFVAGVICTVGFMLLGVILCLIFAIPQAIPDMFTDLPWWKFFLFAWALLDGAMVLIIVFEKRK